MGNIINKLFGGTVADTRTGRVWPIRYFHQITSPEDMQSSRFSRWDPRMHTKTLKYPAQEPAKDF